LLAIREYALKERRVLLGLLIFAAVLSTIFSRLALIDRLTPSATPFSVERVDSSDVGLGTYLLTFVLPFVAVTGATPADILVLVCFFVLLGFLLVNSRTLLPNPVLVLLHYKWIVVTLKTGDQRQVLVPPSYPLQEHLHPAVAVGPKSLSAEPHLEMCPLTESVWLAKMVAR
jgi:hypothetical protein